MRIDPRSPILAAGDWGGLLETLSRSPDGAALAEASRSVAMGVLAAPAAVARWIAERAPGLMERSPLRLLIVGAERLDAVDRGRWYHLIPALLGVEGRVDVTLVGERLHTEFDRALVETDLPERPDYERVNEFLVKARRLAVAEVLR